MKPFSHEILLFVILVEKVAISYDHVSLLFVILVESTSRDWCTVGYFFIPTPKWNFVFWLFLYPLYHNGCLWWSPENQGFRGPYLWFIIFISHFSKDILVFVNPHGKCGCFIWARLFADRLGNLGCVKNRSSKKRMRTCGAAIFFLRELRNFVALKIILWCETLYTYGVNVLQRWRCLNNLSCFTLWNRWDYSNPGYLDSLKHLTDLKEEG